MTGGEQTMEGQTIEIRRSNRKSMQLELKADGGILVRAPMRTPEAEIFRFVRKNEGWIEKHRKKQEELRKNMPETEKLSMDEIRALADKALADIPERLQKFAPEVGVSYGRVTIRNQRSKWGSCSAKGNLNFNCLLMLAPSDVVDYVVVHELCHRKEMNHSPRFWAEVERVLPNYKEPRRWLKENGELLMRRMTG